MLKIILLLSFTLLFLQDILSQNLVISDKSSLKPIENVLITDTDSSFQRFSNKQGIIRLDTLKINQLYIISHPAYEQLYLTGSEITDQSYQLVLKEKLINIQEIVIKATFWERDYQHQFNSFYRLKPKDISFQNPQTAADALENTGQVFVQRSQAGGGSPMIRGHAANAVLIVVDGVRMNHAIFRSGNLHNVNSVNPAILEGGEIIYGPGSVMFGSDALGGVMNFRTKNPVFSNNNQLLVQGNAFTRYASANNEKTQHADVALSWKKFASLTGITYSDFSHLRAGTRRPQSFPEFGKRNSYVQTFHGRDSTLNNPNPNLQKLSAYNQLGIFQKLRYRPVEWLDITYNLQHNTISEMPRYDRLIEERNGKPRVAEWYYGPQAWTLNALHLHIYQKKLFDFANITLAHQLANESRHDRGFGQAERRNRFEKVNIGSFNADFEKNLSNHHSIGYGIEFIHNHVASHAYAEDILTGTNSPIQPRYPAGGSRVNSAALYVLHKWKINTILSANSGLRYSLVNIHGSFGQSEPVSFMPFQEFNLQNKALNGNIGLRCTPIQNLNINLTFSSGFRAPNIDDVAKFFDSEPGNVMVPNPNLKPENLYNAELGIGHNITKILHIQATGFYSFMQDAMVRRNTRWNGNDSILYDGNLSRVQTIMNTGRAHIYGFHTQVHIRPTTFLEAASSLTYTKGEDLDDEIPWRHAPPVFGQTSIISKYKNLKGEFFVRYNGGIAFNNLPPSEQNKAYLYTTAGALPWYTLNLRFLWEFHQHFSMTLAMENITDNHYRPYSSGISAPGRNLIVSLKASF
jgi:hemoglobin/transferrin/lactoferrin receptor protein